MDATVTTGLVVAKETPFVHLDPSQSSLGNAQDTAVLPEVPHSFGHDC